jgi:hypothetical protein
VKAYRITHRDRINQETSAIHFNQSVIRTKVAEEREGGAGYSSAPTEFFWRVARASENVKSNVL